VLVRQGLVGRMFGVLVGRGLCLGHFEVLAHCWSPSFVSPSCGGFCDLFWGAWLLRCWRVCFFGCCRCAGRRSSISSTTAVVPASGVALSPLRAAFSASRLNLAFSASVLGAGLLRIT